MSKIGFDEEEMKNIVLFFNHHTGTELYPDFSPVVNDPRNPYYNSEETADIQWLITEKSISPMFVKYLVEDEMIAFAQSKDMDDQTIKENLDFLLRYFKRKDYFDKPRVTIIV